MKKFAKTIDEETKLCEIGLGDDAEYYTSIGMSEQEVEQAYNGMWYLQGYAPVKPEPTIEERNEEIRQKREQAYQKTSDHLKQDYDEALARGEADAEEKKQLWLASKDKVREDNPYVVEPPSEPLPEEVFSDNSSTVDNQVIDK